MVKKRAIEIRSFFRTTSFLIEIVQWTTISPRLKEWRLQSFFIESHTTIKDLLFCLKKKSLVMAGSSHWLCQSGDFRRKQLGIMKLSTAKKKKVQASTPSSRRTRWPISSRWALIRLTTSSAAAAASAAAFDRRRDELPTAPSAATLFARFTPFCVAIPSTFLSTGRPLRGHDKTQKKSHLNQLFHFK